MTDEELLQTQELARAGVIFAPASFLNASLTTLKDSCNGCGAGGSWFRPPSTMYGTSIIEACIVHDWMYEQGRVIEDKEEADRVFLNNMIRLIELDEIYWYKPTFLQRRRALKYYEAVNDFGGTAFWAGKA